MVRLSLFRQLNFELEALPARRFPGVIRFPVVLRGSLEGLAWPSEPVNDRHGGRHRGSVWLLARTQLTERRSPAEPPPKSLTVRYAGRFFSPTTSRKDDMSPSASRRRRAPEAVANSADAEAAMFIKAQV